MAESLVYVAGPLFTPGQRTYLEEISAEIENLGSDVFLPHREFGTPDSDDVDSSTIFNKNIDYIDKADIIVANLSGFDVDSGTAFELGYAYRQNKTLLGIVEDTRISNNIDYENDTDINLMITNSVTITRSIDVLVDEIREHL